MKPLIAVAAVTALGAVGFTIWVGSHVREDTVVERPYEEGLQLDAERRARERLGWTVAVVEVPPSGAEAPLRFEVRDPAGTPVEGATVRLLVGRRETSRGQWSAEARPDAAGRGYEAALRFPAAGAWDVRFEIARGDDRVRLTRSVQVRTGAAGAAAAPACDLAAGPCTLPLDGGGELTLDLGPRPLRTMHELAVAAEVRERGAPLAGARVEVAFEMPGMAMGPNRSELAAAAEAGRYAGSGVLVRCPSGRKDWVANVRVIPASGAARTARVPFRVVE